MACPSPPSRPPSCTTDSAAGAAARVVLQPDQPSRNRSTRSRCADAGSIHYFYVVDEHNKLVGVVPTRGLLTAASDKLVREVMVDNVVAIPTGRRCDRERVFRDAPAARIPGGQFRRTVARCRRPSACSRIK